MPREGHDRRARRCELYRCGISIHVPREGHDDMFCVTPPINSAFQSTCPARGTTGYNRCRQRDTGISIHVPREGHDVDHVVTTKATPWISIHVPREGHDTVITAADNVTQAFQSTCPARGTTYASTLYVTRASFQSTCPARGTTQTMPPKVSQQLFQSTCPARGTTSSIIVHHPSKSYFNPRAPRGARQQTCTIFSCRFAQELQISR